MRYIVDDIGSVVAKMRPTVPPVDPQAPGAGAPYYMYGHRLEVANILKSKGTDSVRALQRYPLIVLNMDVAERIEGDMVRYNLNIGIFTITDKKYRAEERYENIFKPVLYPLYDSFFTQLKNIGLFSWSGNQALPKHLKIDRPFWGKTGIEGNEAELFNDPIDAIEILNLEVSQRIKC